MLIHWFLYKVLHDFEAKNPISSIKRIELPDTFKFFIGVMMFYLQFCIIP